MEKVIKAFFTLLLSVAFSLAAEGKSSGSFYIGVQGKIGPEYSAFMTRTVEKLKGNIARATGWTAALDKDGRALVDSLEARLLEKSRDAVSIEPVRTGYDAIFFVRLDSATPGSVNVSVTKMNYNMTEAPGAHFDEVPTSLLGESRMSELVALSLTRDLGLKYDSSRLSDLEEWMNERKQEQKLDRILTWVAPSVVCIKNGEPTSGALLLSGELLSVGGGVFTYAKSISLIKKLKEDDWNRKQNNGMALTDLERARVENQYKTCQALNYICWGSVVLIHTVSVVMANKIVANKSYALAPSVLQNSNRDYAYGISLTYRF